VTAPRPGGYVSCRAKADVIALSWQIANLSEAGRQGRAAAPLTFLDIRAKALEIVTIMQTVPVKDEENEQ
jgi:hypothetical protein